MESTSEPTVDELMNEVILPSISYDRMRENIERWISLTVKYNELVVKHNAINAQNQYLEDQLKVYQDRAASMQSTAKHITLENFKLVSHYKLLQMHYKKLLTDNVALKIQLDNATKTKVETQQSLDFIRANLTQVKQYCELLESAWQPPIPPPPPLIQIEPVSTEVTNYEPVTPTSIDDTTQCDESTISTLPILDIASAPDSIESTASDSATSTASDAVASTAPESIEPEIILLSNTVARKWPHKTYRDDAKFYGKKKSRTSIVPLSIRWGLSCKSQNKGPGLHLIACGRMITGRPFRLALSSLLEVLHSTPLEQARLYCYLRNTLHGCHQSEEQLRTSILELMSPLLEKINIVALENTAFEYNVKLPVEQQLRNATRLFSLTAPTDSPVVSDPVSA